MAEIPVSVAIATYNGAKYLKEQLDSILAQSYPPAEIVVSDDRSSDGTAEILRAYEAKGLLRFTISDQNLGYIGNFKRAVAMCKPGNYVALSDQDDVWLPGKIEAAVRVMEAIPEQEKPLMVYSDLVLVDPFLKVLNPSFRNELGQDCYEHCLDTVLFGGFVNGCTMLMNPEMVSYFDTIPANGGAPHDSWISLIAHTFGGVAQVDEALIWYRKHSANATELEAHQKKSRWMRLKDEVIASFSSNDLFEKEIVMAGLFYEKFKDRLDPEQDRLFRKFLELKGSSYLRKKLTLRKFFRGKWQRA